ncbi:response regulator [Radiobacillus sp. PE A8.2]|uniref:response regulator transcription factor n=1 Tax=Radiobacillus sp. PE A8.2 TaxID=3380349 RepID=UPI00388D2C9E
MKNVLLVDDEAGIRKGVKKLLEEVITGYKVMWESSNGKDALEIVAIDLPDLIISDIRMPEMNGLDFITVSKEKYPSLPIIIISGYDDFAYAKEALRLGVDDYLLKPIGRSDLASTLERIEKRDKPSTEEVGEKVSVNIRRIIHVIDNNLEKELTLRFISDRVNLHPNYASQLFKQETNKKLFDYITERRMKKARQLLKKTNLKIYDIAHLVGYENSKHFSTTFKKAVGMTPYEYRRKL